MKKKLLVLVLALVMMVTAAMPAFAADVLTTKGASHAGLQSTASVGATNGASRTTANVQRKLQELARMEVEAISKTDPRFSEVATFAPPQWKYEYGEIKYVDVSGYPSGQPKNGYSFPAYGGDVVCYAPGGPDVSFSVNFSSPYLPFSGTINIGTMTGSGTGVAHCKIPALNNFYKVRVIKTMAVQPFISYYLENGIWVKYIASATASVDRVTAVPEIVKL